MALNIPLPGLPFANLNQSIATGGNLFSQMMQPVIQRENMARQWRQHMDSMELQRAAAGRAAANADINRQILQERLKLLKDKNPLALLQKLQEMQNQGQSQPVNSESPSFIPSISDVDLLGNESQMTGQGMFPSSEESGIPADISSEIPQLNTNPVSEFEGANPKSINGIPLDYLMQAITAKSLGLPVPKLGGNQGSYQGVAREAKDLERLKQEAGEQSPVYQNAKKAYDAKLNAQQDLSNIRGRTLGGLKPGERWLLDPNTQEPIGKEIPLTALERNEYKGRGFFNYAFPLISRGLAPISGKGSYSKLKEAANNYGKNPESTRIIDDFLLAKKMSTAAKVKEAATLAAGKQKIVFEQLGKSLDSSDIPDAFAAIIKQFKLPPTAAIKADKRFQRELNAATSAGEKAAPAFQKQYFNPEQYVQDNEPESEALPVIIIDPNGQKFETTEANAAHLPKGWSRE